jgi:hypothetical protein
MSPRAWVHWKRRYAEECKARAAISEASKAYRRIYGQAEAAEVESLAKGDPEDFDREPVYPSYDGKSLSVGIS